MYAEIVLVISAPFLGVITGMMPGLGATLIMVLLYPLLIHFHPVAVIMFYAVMINARDFSGSVAALCFGMLGEITAGPALRERGRLIDSGLQLAALKNTMWGSFTGMVISFACLILLLYAFQDITWLFRTSVMAVFLLISLVFLTLWPGNRPVMNLILIATGISLGLVGWHRNSGVDIMVFDNVYLSGGLPVVPLLLGLYAIPLMIKIAKNHVPNQYIYMSSETGTKVPWTSILQGTASGFVVGLIPFVGALIVSNFSYWIEKLRHSKDNGDHAMRRLVAAESANNASQVAVLFPFLLLGLAVQGSELVLLDILDAAGWYAIQTVDWQLVAMIGAVMIPGCWISAYLCYFSVSKLLKFFAVYYHYIVTVLVIALVSGIAYMGWSSDQTGYYLAVTLFSALLGTILAKKLDLLPLVMAFLLQNHYEDTAYRLIQLYL